MRCPTLVASPLAWLTGLFRPWVVATVGGAGIGVGLLNVAPPTEGLGSYPEFGPRAAVYDPATTESAQPMTDGSRESLATSPASADGAVGFDSASPITTVEELGSAKLPATP